MRGNLCGKTTFAGSAAYNTYLVEVGNATPLFKNGTGGLSYYNRPIGMKPFQ